MAGIGFSAELSFLLTSVGWGERDCGAAIELRVDEDPNSLKLGALWA